MERLYPSAAYRRPIEPERIFAPEALRREILALSDRSAAEYPRLPASVLVRMEEARILDRALYAMRDGAPRPLYETQRHGDRPYLTWRDPSGPAEELPEGVDYLLLTSAGAFNWGHWLVDDLARLKGVRRLASGRPLCLLLHGFVPEIDRLRLASLEALIGGRRRVRTRLLRPDRVYAARSLFYVSPVSVHPALKHPEALADLAAAGQAAAARGARRLFGRAAGARPRRLFVLRRPGRGRVPVNLDEVARLAMARGYAPFDPEGASAAEQIAAFAAADRVVGCMGAAMAGTVFCPAGAEVLHLAPETFLDPFYWDQAAARGHRYAACYGEALDPARGVMADYRLDPALFAAALAALG